MLLRVSRAGATGLRVEVRGTAASRAEAVAFADAVRARAGGEPALSFSEAPEKGRLAFALELAASADAPRAPEGGPK